MQPTSTFPTLVQVVLDTTDVRRLAEFYRELLGYEYRPGDEPRQGEQNLDWLGLRHPSGSPRIAFQLTERLPRSTWPKPDIPQQLHLDLSVSNKPELDAQHERVLKMGATLIFDRSEDPQEPLYVYADPAGHPFCIFVAPTTA
ncbi:MAG: VOC family protein [Chloroflexi bacterium]|nr:VOC family protein [Chloroflexota bacterium]